MKKILFVSFSLPPYLYPQSIQIGRLLEYFKKNNDFDITVLTADENTKKDTTLYPTLFDGIKDVVQVPYKKNKYIEYIKNRYLSFFYQRPDLYQEWMDKAYKAITAKYPENSFDTILTFSYPLSTNVLGKKLKEYYKCSWIAHQSDPWADNPYMHFNFLTKMINKRLEKNCFEQADKLIFVSPETESFYKSLYKPLEAKMYCIEHSYDEALYSKEAQQKQQNIKTIFRYIGSFYGKRTPEPFFKAMNLLDKSLLKHMIFEIVGGGRIVKELIKKYNLQEFVKIIPTVSYTESLKLMNTSDVLVIIDAPSEIESIFFPSKLVDYIGSQRPILGISPKGTSMRVIKELNYACYDTNEINPIANAIKMILDNQYQEITNREIMQKYTIQHNSDLLKSLI